jgi:hypothetical protein
MIFTTKSPNKIHKYIIDKFLSKNIVNSNNIVFSNLNNNLYEYNNIKDIILNYKDFLTSIMSCMFTLDFRMNIIYAFFDSIVDYIIEYNCYDKLKDDDNINIFFIIFVYLSSEKLYEYINYIYQSSNQNNKIFLNKVLFDKIYISIVYNGSIVTMVKYGYKNNEDYENIIYPYYLTIERLYSENILYYDNNFEENNEIDLVDCKKSKDKLYIKIVTNVLKDMKVHLKK